MHLPEETFHSIVSITNKAKIEVKRENYAKALSFYQQAEAAFPQPAEQYTGACFLFYSMAELYFLLNEEAAAIKYLTMASACLDGVTDDKIWYRFGLLHFQKGDTQKAIINFQKAFAISGKKTFVSTVAEETRFFETHIFNETENAG
jgi:tetratricopeptide (TPR) repeat protein